MGQQDVDKLLEHDGNVGPSYSQTLSESFAGCSERPSGKAAASEEAKRYKTALRVSRSPMQWILANGKAPPVLPTSENFIRYIEPLSTARTPLADFVNSLLGASEYDSQDFSK